MKTNRLTIGEIWTWCPHGLFIRPVKCSQCPEPVARGCTVTKVNRDADVITLDSDYDDR